MHFLLNFTCLILRVLSPVWLRLMMEFICFCTFFLVLWSEARTRTYPNKLVVDCLNKPDNTGKYLVNTFFADTSRGWRAQPLRGASQPASLQVHSLNERIGYAWIKGESSEWAYFKVTSQQMLIGKYVYEAWSYKGMSAFAVSSSSTLQKFFLQISGFPAFIRCSGMDGQNKNGYCELTGPKRTQFNTLRVPFSGTVHDIELTSVPSGTAFKSLKYQRITKGGAIHNQYWDYRNNKWNSDDCFTFTAYFSDGHTCQVTAPVKDFKTVFYAKSKAEQMLIVLGKIPKFIRSWLKTIAINGDGKGARAGANSWRKSMTLNLARYIIQSAYELFLHEGAHVALLYVEQSAKWKKAQQLDPLFISSYAKGSPKSEDVAESIVPWMKVRSDPNLSQSQKIKQTIPNRLAVLSDLICSKYPSYC